MDGRIEGIFLLMEARWHPALYGRRQRDGVSGGARFDDEGAVNPGNWRPAFTDLCDEEGGCVCAT
jgi:hypothetical protein